MQVPTLKLELLPQKTEGLPVIKVMYMKIYK